MFFPRSHLWFQSEPCIKDTSRRCDGSAVRPPVSWPQSWHVSNPLSAAPYGSAIVFPDRSRAWRAVADRVRAAVPLLKRDTVASLTTSDIGRAGAKFVTKPGVGRKPARRMQIRRYIPGAGVHRREPLFRRQQGHGFSEKDLCKLFCRLPDRQGIRCRTETGGFSIRTDA